MLAWLFFPPLTSLGSILCTPQLVSYNRAKLWTAKPALDPPIAQLLLIFCFLYLSVLLTSCLLNYLLSCCYWCKQFFNNKKILDASNKSPVHLLISEFFHMFIMNFKITESQRRSLKSVNHWLWRSLKSSNEIFFYQINNLFRLMVPCHWKIWQAVITTPTYLMAWKVGFYCYISTFSFYYLLLSFLSCFLHKYLPTKGKKKLL